jgi:hypothetical protein
MAIVGRQVRMAETPREWNPLRLPEPGALRLIQLREAYDEDGLALYRGRALEPIVILRFARSLAYRSSSPSVFIRTWRKEIPYPSYTIDHSNSVAWLHEESYGQYDKESIVHYVLAPGHSFVEVLATREPSVHYPRN